MKKQKLEKKQIQISIPIVDPFDGMVLIMEMLSLGNGDGSVATGTGMGSDAIVLEWKGRRALIRGLDLMRAWMETFDPESAKRLPT